MDRLDVGRRQAPAPAESAPCVKEVQVLAFRREVEGER